MNPDQILYEVDMERWYEDSSFRFDQVNQELQLATNDLRDREIDRQYFEMIDEIFSDRYENFNGHYSDF